MARKNRSNNSFAPIVITVLVAGVVGYYAFIKSPPQSTLADGDGQGGFTVERAPDSSPSKPSAGAGSKLGGDSTTSGILTPKSPQDAAGGKLGEAAPATPSPTPSRLPEPQGGLRPDPIPESASKLSAPEVVTPTTPARPSDSADSDTQETDGSESAPSVKPEPKTEPTPTVAPAPKPKPVASTEVYTVQDGDVIISIAEDWFGESGRHDEIIALNPGVDPTKLQIGQILKMPRKSQPRTKPVDPTLAANEYRIAPNDNYTRIARLLLGDEARASEIAALNPDLDPGNLQVGTIIKLPPKRVRKPAARPVKRPPLRTGEKYYTVKSGDSLARIVGDLWGVQREDWVELLYQRNKDTIGEDRTKLNLEQILVIPVKPKS